jgi:hypothetical protein
MTAWHSSRQCAICCSARSLICCFRVSYPRPLNLFSNTFLCINTLLSRTPLKFAFAGLKKEHPVSFCAVCNGSFEITAIRLWKETKKQHLNSVQRNLVKKNHWSFRQLKWRFSKEWGFKQPQLLPYSLLESVMWVSADVTCKIARRTKPHKNGCIYDNAVTRNICWQKWWKDAKCCHLSGTKLNGEFVTYPRIILITFRRPWNNQTTVYCQTWDSNVSCARDIQHVEFYRLSLCQEFSTFRSTIPSSSLRQIGKSKHKLSCIGRI